MAKLFTIFVVVLLMWPSNIAIAQSEEEAVITAVRKFFLAMSARDTSATLEVLLAEGQYFSIREDSSQISIRNTTYTEYLNKLATSKENWLEKMREPKVLVHDRVAILWTKYDFYRSGQFSHCGVDAFSLLKTAEGWKIVGFIYNVEPKVCDK